MPRSVGVVLRGSGGEKNAARRRRRRCCSSGCFKACRGERGAVEAAGDGGGGREVAEDERLRQTHLVVTVNGIVGSSANWRYAAKQFVKKYPDDVIVHCSESNYNLLTLDGVDVMGERLAKEVLAIVAQRPELQKISFVAHSLGGLVSRYAIALLYGQNVHRKSSSEKIGETMTQDCGFKCSKKSFQGRIAGMEPMNFITFATPHLGSKWHKQIPILGGSHALEKVVYNLSCIVGRSGKHLFLKDTEDCEPPLLFRMVNDCGDLPFMSALQSFKCRVLYSNVCSDFIVGRKTSSIRFQHELPKRKNFVKNAKYPHVVYVEKPRASEASHDIFGSQLSQPKTASEMEEAMIMSLNRLAWDRVEVSFKGSFQRIFAHSTIQVKSYAIHSAGADVIFHMIDNFLL